MRRKFLSVVILLFCMSAFAQSADELAHGSVARGVSDTLHYATVDDDVDDGYVIVDGRREVLVRLEFEGGSDELTERSVEALVDVTGIFSDGTLRRYEVHGHFCAGVDGSRRTAMMRAETVVEYLTLQGVFEANILSLVNASTQRVTARRGCEVDRRVDVMTVELRRVRKEDVVVPVVVEEVVVADIVDDVVAPVVEDVVVDDVVSDEPTAGELDELMRRGRAAFEPEPVIIQEPEPIIVPIAPIVPAIAPEIAQGRATVAIYMAGEEPPAVRGAHSIFGGEMARVISESDRYIAVDRTEIILEQLALEHEYQRSGAVDDDQIKALGQQLGVQYLSISNIIPVGRRYYLDTRLVDVVTAEINRSVTATSDLRDAIEKMRVAREIANELIEPEQTRARRLRRQRIFRYTAIGLNVLGVGAAAYGYLVEENNVVRYIDDDLPQDAERAAERRNAAYIVGGALIAAGVTIHILF